MTKACCIVALIFLFACKHQHTDSGLDIEKPDYVLLIHGGAGTITKENLTPNKERAYREKLEAVLNKGEDMLRDGARSIDVVEELVRIMENSPLFNAGKGSVFNANGVQDMDASIMNGADLNCGSVAGVSNVKNPIKLARLVMDSSEHVFLSRLGAEDFAVAQGMEMVKADYFFDQARYDSWQRIQERENEDRSDEKHGTVGVVCLDKSGNLAAGTSTGGMTNKKWGRIGDSPIIGAGTYANNNSCAVSCTGHGEFFIRAMVAHDIAALVEYQNMSVEKATNEVINNKLLKLGGSGGAIVLDSKGNFSLQFNTEAMYRGYIRSGEKAKVLIYK